MSNPKKPDKVTYPKEITCAWGRFAANSGAKSNSDDYLMACKNNDEAFDYADSVVVGVYKLDRVVRIEKRVTITETPQ